MPADQSKYWVWTLNNYTEEECKAIACVYEVGGTGAPSYICFGREIGESGTRHLQGYIEFPIKTTLSVVKKFMGSRIHAERRRGTQSQAITYTRKDGDWVEFGSPFVSKQGERRDVAELLGELQSGVRLSVLALQNPNEYCRNRNGLKDLARFCAKRRTGPPRVEYVWGPPGTGKSRYAYSREIEDTWTYPGSFWFDGYEGQSTAIFDDFDDDCCQRGERSISYGTFLRLLDRYPMQVPIKGGFTEWCPSLIIITSNRSLCVVYAGHNAYQRDAVMRRVTEIKHFE